MVAGAAIIFVTMLGAAYAGATGGKGGAAPLRLVSVQRSVHRPEAQAPPPPVEEAVPIGREAPQAIADLLDATREMVDPISGMRMGPVTFLPAAEDSSSVAPASASSREGRSSRGRSSSASRRRPARRQPAPSPAPSTPPPHGDPGRHVIATARAMNAAGEAMNGSCYRYLSEVFSRAGHSGWRARRVVYREGRGGPYADLDLMRAGDWLYIVNHPERTPVGTHSVLFVGWENRARGIARVIEHPGWGAAATGRERWYDVSRTYRIIRPVRR